MERLSEGGWDSAVVHEIEEEKGRQGKGTRGNEREGGKKREIKENQWAVMDVQGGRKGGRAGGREGWEVKIWGM